MAAETTKNLTEAIDKAKKTYEDKKTVKGALKTSFDTIKEVSSASKHVQDKIKSDLTFAAHKAGA